MKGGITYKKGFWSIFHFVEMNFSTIFPIPNNFTHERHLDNPSKVPFELLSHMQEKEGLRFDIIFLNNTEVCAF